MSAREQRPPAIEISEISSAPRRAPARGRKMLVAGVVALAFLFGYNLLIARMARTSQRQQMLRTLAALPNDTDCVFLGNSLVEAGCDMRAFSTAWDRTRGSLSPQNLALGATSPVEHYLIFHQALQHPLHLKYLVYGFFDDQLNAAPRGDWADLMGNRALSYYFPDEAAGFYAPGSWLKQWELRLVGHIPMLAERSSFWGKVELLRRSLGDIGMPKHKTNRFGRVDDFSALEAKDVDSFTRRCEAVIARQVGLSTPIREIIRLARERGAQVILVEMPMPSRHRQVFYASPAWKRMQDYLRTLAEREHTVYVSASDWVDDDKNFEDATHLNEQGARVFSTRLAHAIARLEPMKSQVAEKGQ